MRFVLELTLGNDAMSDLVDVKRAIAASLDAAESALGFSGDSSTLRAGDSFHVRDGNGNTVGRWTVVED